MNYVSSMRNILSCFVIFFVGFRLIAGATQWNVVVASDHNLVGFLRGSETEDGFFSVSANAAKRREFAHLVAMRNQIQERADAFFFKVAVQAAYVHSLARFHVAQYAHDVPKELALIDEKHVGFGHFGGVTRFQLFNGGAHDAGYHGAVVGGKQRIFGRCVARVARKIDNHHAHVAIGALLVQVGQPRGFS